MTVSCSFAVAWLQQIEVSHDSSWTQIEDFADDEEFMADEDAFDDEFGGAESQGDFAAPTPGVAMAPVDQEWGGLVFGAVLMASIAMLICGGVMIDLVRYMWRSGENGIVAGPLVDMLGM